MVRKWIIHFVADCTICDWSTEDYLTGQEAASEHARKTGHIVNAEAGYAVRYGTEQPDNCKKE